MKLWSIERASAAPNLIGVAAVAAKFFTPLRIELIAQKEIDQLSLKRWTYKVLD